MRVGFVCALKLKIKSCLSLAQTEHIGLNELIQEYNTRVNPGPDRYIDLSELIFRFQQEIQLASHGVA